MQTIKNFLAALAIVAVAASCNTPTASSSANPAPASAPMAEKPVMQDDFRKMAPEPGPAPEIQLGDFQDFKLDNGLQVVLVENHKLPRVSYQLFVDVPAHLENDYAGAGDMMGNMLRRATATQTKEQIDEEIDFIGANLSTSANGAYASTISKYKEQVLGMMADVVLNARFPEEEFAKVKSEAAANLQQELNDPGSIASRVRRVTTYGANHPYGELMTEKSLENINLAIVKDYYNDYFVPNRSYLVMVGDLTLAEAKKLATENFSEWAAKEVAVPEFVDPSPPEGTMVTFVPRPGAVQSNIVISRPIDLEVGSKESIRANILNTILGQGLASRLNANLRETKAYTYGARSGIDADKLVGSFQATADVRNEVTDSSIVEFLYELNKISEEAVTDKELAVTKTRITGSFGRALESPQRIASYALNTVRYGLDRDFYPTYLQKVQNSSKNDVLEVARNTVSPENAHIIVVGDKAVAEKLARFASNGKINYVDANGMPLEMSETAVAADVTPKSIIMKYTEAIGGAAAIAKVNNYLMMMEASIQGQTIEQTFAKEGGNRFSSQTKMSGMVLADQRYNDGKAKMSQQGQVMPMDEDMISRTQEEARLFPTADLMERLDDLTVEGVEKVGDRDAYVVLVKTGDQQERNYFDTETGLLVRQVSQQGGATVSTMLSDYQAVEGVKFPHSVRVVGVAPFPLEMKITDLKVNTEIDESLFSVE